MTVNIENFCIQQQEQCDCEKICSEYLKPLCTYTGKVRRKLKGQSLSNQKDEVCLLRKAHIDYLTAGLEALPEGFISLDASRPWICYWICHALYLLHCEPVHLYSRIVSTLSCMQNVSGGYGKLNTILSALYLINLDDLTATATSNIPVPSNFLLPTNYTTSLY